MVLILHIVIALTSLAFATYTVQKPSTQSLRVSYGLVISTLASGTYLTILSPSHMVQSCSVGLLYVSVVFLLNSFASKKLARASVHEQ